MPFWKKKDWEDEYQEYYAERAPREVQKYRIWPHILALGFISVLFLGAVGIIAGQSMFEKTLTALASPVGFVWLALSVMIYFALLMRQRGPAMIGLACWFVLTIAGNGFVSNWLAERYESEYIATDLEKMQPLDVAFVMGGGTSTRLNGTPQATSTGDRIVTAATLYHQGKAKILICTGTQENRSTEKDLNPHEEAAKLLLSMGVPQTSIREMRGKNTFEESRNMKTWIDDNPDVKRIGVLSSAWHLPRVLRLCKSAGIEIDLIPVPSNFQSHPFEPSPDLLIPSSGNLERTALLTKEFLAGFVGR